MSKSITQEELKELLTYDPDTGIFTWKNPQARNMKAGDVAGTYHDRGYRLIRINNKSYYAHRLAWLYMTGEWPEDEIDHINRVRDDNRFENLREADHSKGMANRSGYGKSGLKWVYWHNNSQAWQARVTKDYKNHYVGMFDNPYDAHVSAKAKATELHGEFCAA